MPRIWEIGPEPLASGSQPRMSRPCERLKAVAHVPGRRLTIGIADWPSCRRNAHGFGLIDCAGIARPQRATRRSRAEGAVMRLKSLPDYAGGAGLAEGDPLPPEDATPLAPPTFLETLYRAHRGKLLRLLGRRMPGERAQDIVQQAFCRLARLTDAEQQEIAAPGAYLRRTADNLVRDEARQAERRSAHLHLCDEEVALQSTDQLAMLEARDGLRRLEEALERLKPRTREIFLAHRIDGYSYAEIAARTELSIKTVEMHMTRAIAYLDRHRTR